MIPHYPSFYEGGSYSKMDTLYYSIYIDEHGKIKPYFEIILQRQHF